tara:strand:+ start:22 stop:996 length:975 start_codon:yes stop_codon:yes gene_type:complete
LIGILDLPNQHEPVLRDEVITGLNLKRGGVYVDGTFGRGGYSKAILETPSTLVFGIDRDPVAIAFGVELSKKYPGRLIMLEGCFGDMANLIMKKFIKHIDGVTLDLGISTPQIDDPARGFSFRFNGPLDMRMSNRGLTAAEFINNATEEEIANIIYQFGEEKNSRKIAKGITKAREIKPISSTEELVKIIHANVKWPQNGNNPATKTFMVLRIKVNNELEELSKGLIGAEKILVPGGRLAVVSFHSLEDRTVKKFLYKRSGKNSGISRHLPQNLESRATPSFNLVTRHVIKPGALEVSENPRSRSARLRVAERTTAPVLSLEAG